MRANKYLQSSLAFLFISLFVLNTAALAVVPTGGDQKRLTRKAVVSNGVVISQVYGAGGNSGATFNADFVELFNRGTTPVSLNGWSIQYGSATGTGNLGANATAITELPNVTLNPGQYYLVQEASGANGATLPTADLVDATPIAMAAGAGKIALASVAVSLGCNGGSTACSPAQLANIVDLVGYGNANFFEGAAAVATLTATTSGIRNGGGCTETDNNGSDFTAATPTPRNTSTTANSCSSGSTNPSGVGLANPSTVVPGGTSLLTVTVTPGTNPASTGITVVGDLTSIGGTATQAFLDNGTDGDVSAGDNIFSYQATVSAGTSLGAKTLPATISDAQSRPGSANISLTVSSGSTSPTGVGSATPSSVLAGDSSLLTVAVTPGTNPASSGIAVTGDLTSVGGLSTQSFFDNGTNGDVTAGDNVFSYVATVSAGTSAGAKTLPVTVTDAQSRSSITNISITVTAPPAGGQPLPFSQDWTNTGMITANDNWSGVPGIVGYRGDAMVAATGINPQTILQDGSATPVNVVANNTNPGAFTSGGVLEAEITNPAIALQGSGTARAPHVVISVNTTSASNITMQYNLRDIDGSADNSVQPVALQYRVGSSGSFTNIPGAFVADASSGPNEATLVTPVGVLLPAAVENQSLVQLRVITADAVGSDEWIGIDDIQIIPNGTLPLSASGSANPTLVDAGSSVLMTVSVNPGTNPISSGLTVVGDLTSVGGSATQVFFDNGTNGDVTAGDNVFSYSALIGSEQTGGPRSIQVSVTDAQGRSANPTVNFTVRATANPQVHLTLGNPSGAVADTAQENNYLMLKNQYVLSYNRSRANANWVAWHLDTSWIGGAGRQDDFRPDETLPPTWYRVNEFSFSGSGFDRGHHAPSGDRTASIPDNSATFLMTNMMPQAPDNNQGPWEALESHSRSIANQGNELYIYMGGSGIGGVGSNSSATVNTVDNGNVTVPAYTWKVIVVLPNGDNDVSRVNENTRAIAVIMPNRQGIREDAWQKYIATIDQVEALTGYDFLTNVPVPIQDAIESRLDAASNTSPTNISGSFENLRIDSPNTAMTGNVVVDGVLTLGGSTLRTNGNTITLGPNATVNRISGLVEGNLTKQFATAGSFEFPMGTVKGYSPVTFNATVVANPSSLTARSVDGVHPQAPSPDNALRRYWSLTETGDLTGDLTFKYLDSDIPVGVNESTFDLVKYTSIFETIPSTLSPAQNTASATGISSFSDWTLFADFAPSAPASISGKVVDANGRFISRAIVSVTDGVGNTYYAVSNTFGNFVISDVPSGASYTLTARSQRNSFGSQVINLSGNVTGLTVVANP